MKVYMPPRGCGATDGRGFICGRSEGHTGAHSALASSPGGRSLSSIWHDPQLTKETAPCCQAKSLPDGRPPIGYCGPDCLRRAS